MIEEKPLSYSSLHGEDMVSWKEQFQLTFMTNQSPHSFGKVLSPLSEKCEWGVRVLDQVRDSQPWLPLEPPGELLKSCVWAPPQTN